MSFVRNQEAVCLGEALRPEFRDYGRRVVENARTLAKVLADNDLDIVAGGTDTHMVLLDLSAVGLLGREAERALARAGITSNANPVPFDPSNPAMWTGLRLGVAAVTTRGFGKEEMETLGTCIADLLQSEARRSPAEAVARVQSLIAQLVHQTDEATAA